MSEEGTCLVARAIPCSIPDAQIKDEKLEALVEQLDQLNVEEKQKKKEKQSNISPADFVILQSCRSSALAKKTNTTSKFGRGGPALMADLLNNTENLSLNDKDEKKTEKKEVKVAEKKEVKEEKKKEGKKEKKEKKEKEEKEEKKEEKEEKEDEDGKEGELMERGPVRAAPRTASAHHPYMNNYGHAAQSTVEDYSSYTNGYPGGYDCGTYWMDSPESMTSAGYFSQQHTPESQQTCQSPQRQQASPFTDDLISRDDLSRLLNPTELPDPLADFILKYSRRYTNDNAEHKDTSPTRRPPSADSGCESPMSARSCPQTSPGAPNGGSSGPHTPMAVTRSSPRKETAKGAKQRLRALIADEDMTDAFAWTCKCYQYAPGALTYQDTDRDTLLHIVTLHMDLAKIFALVEQQLKTDYRRDHPPFDLPNRFHETPLFLAVQKRRVEVVEYLMEAGANPNTQTLRQERDASIHYAAARGMTEIVEALCAHPDIRVNAMNGMGLTALLCAVRNHGVLEEESGRAIDTRDTIRTLIRHRADPTIADATNGKTLIHYAVERVDAELVELLKKELDDEAMSGLVNLPDLCGETPMQLLNAARVGTDEARSQLFLSLLTCGANMPPSQPQQQQFY